MDFDNGRIIKANLLLIGRSGSGKSCFVNCIIGKYLAKTGCGEPVTKEFHKYEHILKSGLPLTIYDSKGLEVDKYKTISDDIYSYIKKKNQSYFLSDWFHAIFFFVNIKRSRLEEREIQMINKIQDITKQPVNVIMTHCYEKDSVKYKKMLEEIKKIKGVASTFQVNLEDFTDRKHNSFPAYGKSEIENALPEIIWENTATKVSDYISNNLCREIAGSIARHETEQYKRLPLINPIKDTFEKEYLDKLCSTEIDSIFLDVIDKNYSLHDHMIQDFMTLYASFCAVFHNIDSSSLLYRHFWLDLDTKKITKQIKTNIIQQMRESQVVDGPFQAISDFFQRTFDPKVYYMKKQRQIIEDFYKELQKILIKPKSISKYIYEQLVLSKPSADHLQQAIDNIDQNCGW